MCENVDSVKNLLDISGENPAYDFLARVIAAAYRHKFLACFDRDEPLSSLCAYKGETVLALLLDTVRNKTWHRTIMLMNTLPSSDAVRLPDCVWFIVESPNTIVKPTLLSIYVSS